MKWGDLINFLRCFLSLCLYFAFCSIVLIVLQLSSKETTYFVLTSHGCFYFSQNCTMKFLPKTGYDVPYQAPVATFTAKRNPLSFNCQTRAPPVPQRTCCFCKFIRLPVSKRNEAGPWEKERERGTDLRSWVARGRVEYPLFLLLLPFFVVGAAAAATANQILNILLCRHYATLASA